MKNLQASITTDSMWQSCVVAAICALAMSVFSPPSKAQSALGSGRLEGDGGGSQWGSPSRRQHYRPQSSHGHW